MKRGVRIHKCLASSSFSSSSPSIISISLCFFTDKTNIALPEKLYLRFVQLKDEHNYVALFNFKKKWKYLCWKGVIYDRLCLFLLTAPIKSMTDISIEKKKRKATFHLLPTKRLSNYINLKPKKKNRSLCRIQWIQIKKKRRRFANFFLNI